MIYVLANSGVEATRYVVHAHLPKDVRMVVDSSALLGKEFHHDDEVFLVDASVELTQVANAAYGRSWPRPHLFKSVSLPARELITQ